ncbi:MAG: hypothetical protein R3335_13550 [Anaerolineales bacterium]|nr:hypothetical protein [Anaerolineales bacterium]
MELAKLKYLPLLILLIAMALPSGVADAHEFEDIHLVDEALLGPYRITVTALPNPITTGRVLLAAEIDFAASQIPATDCEVQFQVVSTSGESHVLQVDAVSRTTSTGYQYEGEIQIEDAGSYKGSVLVTDSSGPIGQIPFQMDVAEVSPWVKVIVIGMLIQGAIFGLWLLKNVYRVWFGKHPQFKQQSLLS